MVVLEQDPDRQSLKPEQAVKLKLKKTKGPGMFQGLSFKEVIDQLLFLFTRVNIERKVQGAKTNEAGQYKYGSQNHKYDAQCAIEHVSKI